MICMNMNSAAVAISEIHYGSSVMIGGFRGIGSPRETLHASIDQGAKNLILANDNIGSSHVAIAAPIENKQAKRMICSFPLAVKKVIDLLLRRLQLQTETKLNQYEEMQY